MQRNNLKLMLKIEWQVFKGNSVPMDTAGGVKVLAKKRGMIIIFKMTGWVQNQFITLSNRAPCEKPVRFGVARNISVLPVSASQTT